MPYYLIKVNTKYLLIKPGKEKTSYPEKYTITIKAKERGCMLWMPKDWKKSL